MRTCRKRGGVQGGVSLGAGDNGSVPWAHLQEGVGVPGCEGPCHATSAPKHAHGHAHGTHLQDEGLFVALAHQLVLPLAHLALPRPLPLLEFR